VLHVPEGQILDSNNARTLLLQSNEKLDEIMEFDPATGASKVLSKLKSFVNKQVSTQGFYSRNEGNPLLLYRINDDLYFQSGACRVLLDDTISIKVEGNEQARRFELRAQDLIVFQCSYIPKLNTLAGIDPTAFVEEEDFDFYLFVRNIANSSQRRDLIGR